VSATASALALPGTEDLQQLGAVLRDALTSLSVCAQALVEASITSALSALPPARSLARVALRNCPVVEEHLVQNGFSDAGH
jgi:hypothetical protein